MSLSPDAVRTACRTADAWVALRQRVLRIPGVQVAVLHDSEVVLETAHGLADVEAGVPLTPEHRFRIASHSKTFTATAVLRLVEAGRVRLDDTLGDHLQDLPAAVAASTVREVLAHGAGLTRDGEEADHWSLEAAFPTEQGLRESLSDASAVLPRGERFKYSNVGYALLGMLVESVTGRAYVEHVEDDVVQRLGLERTRAEMDAGDDHAVGYTGLSYLDRRLPIDHVTTGVMAGATGFSSTASDVARYAAAHFLGDDRLLSDDGKRLMQREEWEVEGADQHYGLGFEVRLVGERRLVGHGGGYPGHATKTLFDPVDRFAVCVCTNAIDGAAEELAVGVVKLVDVVASGGDVEPALDRWTGRFANVWGVLDVVRAGSRLLGLRLNQPDPTRDALELEPLDDTTLRVSGSNGFGAYGELVRYTFADHGSVTSIRGPGGLTMTPLRDFASALDEAGSVSAPVP